MSMLELRQVSKVYGQGAAEVHALREVSLDVSPAATLAGLVTWIAYAPTLQRATGHAVDAAHLPWWAFGIGAVFAIATSVLASRRPARTMAAVPVVAALAGRPA
jgi:hypothetical protein